MKRLVVFGLLACLLSSFSVFLETSPVRAQGGSDRASDFVIQVKTDNSGSSTNTQFVIPTTGGGYSYNVDCNDDGTFEATAQHGNYTCNYSTAGTYTIRIQDNNGDLTGFPRIYFNNGGDAQKLLTIEQWGKGKWTSMSLAFTGCSNLTGNFTDSPDLSGVTDMSDMFAAAGAFNQNIGNWDTSQVTDMSHLFSFATAFNQDIGNWDTSQVTDMSFMFWDASAFNQPIGSWDTRQVTDMSYMFNFASAFNQPINYNPSTGSWNTGQVTNMMYMFGQASAFNQNIGDWDTSHVTNMSYMFWNASAFNRPIGNWDTSQVTLMINMFEGADAFDQNIGSWNVTSLIRADNMFSGIRLSTANYDALLNGWAGEPTVPHNIVFSGGNSQYCTGGDARFALTVILGWTITDGGHYCPAATTTTITSTPNPSNLGEWVTFTATVTCTVGNPTGFVGFSDGGQSIGIGFVGTSGQATLTTNSLIAGIHPITVTYAGNANYAASISSLYVQLVTAPDLTISQANDAGGQVFLGQGWNWTLTLSNLGNKAGIFASGTPLVLDDLDNTGGVTFGTPAVTNVTNVANSGNIQCAINGSQTLTCTANGATVIVGATTGKFDLVVPATPSQTGTYTNPRSGGTCRVDPNSSIAESDESNNDCTPNAVNAWLTTTTSLTSAPNPSTYGHAVTFTATVTSTAGTPTGMAQFYVDGVSLGSATLSRRTSHQEHVRTGSRDPRDHGDVQRQHRLCAEHEQRV